MTAVFVFGIGRAGPAKHTETDHNKYNRILESCNFKLDQESTLDDPWPHPLGEQPLLTPNFAFSPLVIT